MLEFLEIVGWADFPSQIIFVFVFVFIYLFPKIPYTGMYPMDVGIVNKLAH